MDQQTPQVHNWINWLKESHEKFEQEVGGKVFVIFSVKEGKGMKYIYNESAIVETLNKTIILFGGPK